MTMKQQERDMLEKIRTMVDELGEDSYLGSAFDGAFNLAEQNIEFDAAFTTQYYMDKSNEFDNEVRHYQKEIKEFQRKVEKLQADLDKEQE